MTQAQAIASVPPEPIERRNTVPVRENPMPWTLTAYGNRVDLLSPSADQIDWREITLALSNIPRFTGHRDPWRVPNPWNVENHLALGWYLEGSVSLDTAYWLLHDAHEYVVNDISSKVIEAVAIIAGVDAIGIIKERLDKPIHEAFGLAWPPPASVQHHVARLDARAGRIERAILLPDHKDAPSQPVSAIERQCFDLAASDDSVDLAYMFARLVEVGLIKLPEMDG